MRIRSYALMEHLDNLRVRILQTLCDNPCKTFENYNSSFRILFTQALKLISLDAKCLALISGDCRGSVFAATERGRPSKYPSLLNFCYGEQIAIMRGVDEGMRLKGR